MDQEAEKRANEFWESHIAQCGDSFFLSKPEGGFGIGAVRFVEMKGLYREMVKHPITEADKLNGLEWTGTSVLQAKVERTKFRKESWSEWYGPGFVGSISITKKAGVWAIGPIDFTLVNCADVPK